MFIDCPGCGKSYHIIKAALGSSGRRVVCPRCDSIWFVPGEAELHPDFGPPDCAEDPSASADLFESLGEPIEVTLPAADLRAIGQNPVPRPPRAAARPPSRPVSTLKVGLCCLALSMAVIGLRSHIVRLWPRSASAYAALGLPVNLRGLVLQNFKTVTLGDGSGRVLDVEGEIRNLRSEATKIPPLRLAIRDQSGRAIYSWTANAPAPRLAAHDTLIFRARLAVPPAEGRDVLVDFVPNPDPSRVSGPAKAAAAAAHKGRQAQSHAQIHGSAATLGASDLSHL